MSPPPPNLLTPTSVILPLATTSVTVYGLLTEGAGTLWLAGSCAMILEAGLWAARYRWTYARAAGIVRPPLKGIAVLACCAGVGAYVVNVARVGAGLLVFGAWLVIVPNLERARTWRKQRRTAVVEEVLATAETVGLVARCAQAMAVLRGSRPAGPPPPSPEVANHQAGATQRAASDARWTSGVLHTLADGSLFFEEMPS